MSRAAPSEAADRLAVAGEVLRRRGLVGCGAAAAGIEGEVLLLTPRDAAQEAALVSRSLADELRAAGFRYVAIDLAAGTDEEDG